MQYYGYMGKILHVDLSKREIREEELDLNLARKFIGGFGINAKLVYDLIQPGIAPLSPDNVLVIGSGPLSGTLAPGAARCSAWTKYPVTGWIGPGDGSMGFGCGLRCAGYDHLVITGRADRPSYLRVSDDGVEICDAEELWGKDINEATDEIWRRYGKLNSVVCIGQSGENLVKISMALIDKSGTMGRFGLGAVMGSKNLKLILAGGRKKIRVARPREFLELTNRIMDEVRRWPRHAEFVKVGHQEFDFDGLVRLVGVRNYYTERYETIDVFRERFGPRAYLENLKKARLACPGCPIACRDVQEVKSGEYKGLFVYSQGPVHSHGEQLDLKNWGELTKLTDALQRYGLDRVAVIMGGQFLIHLNKLGLVPEAELEGLKIGDEKSFTRLCEKIAFRQGVGDVLADGIEGIVRRFGQECKKHVQHIKGADVYFDARQSGFGTFNLDLVVSPLGPNNGKGGQTTPGKWEIGNIEAFRKYGEGVGIPKENMDKILDSPYKVNMARLLKHTQDTFCVISCLSLCERHHMAPYYTYDMDRLAKLYTYATGTEMDTVELKKASDRIWTLYKALNVREGQTRKDDTFPRFWFEPLKDAGGEIRMMDHFRTKILTREDMEDILDDYYDERGWEKTRGIPSKDKLLELGLSDIIDDLERHGVS